MRVFVNSISPQSLNLCPRLLSTLTTAIAFRPITLALRPPVCVTAAARRRVQHRSLDLSATTLPHCKMEAEAAAATATQPPLNGADVASTSGREVPILDRDSFKQILNVLALRVPNRKCSELMKAFRGYTLDRPKLRCIVSDGSSSETKLLLLDEKVTSLEVLPPELQARVSSEGLVCLPHSLTLGYSSLPADAVLKRLLPPGVDAPSSFETIGHIAHLNLREEQLPYRALIGAVLLDKNPHLRTIVNKVGSIENEFRVFAMEVIAGEQRLETEVTQHGARFRLDFSQVYWNSRLESEHSRLVGQLRAGQVLVDMMAGIGPFAIPAAQRGVEVYANDLNPRSAHYLALNARLNRLGAGAAAGAAANPSTASQPKSQQQQQGQQQQGQGQSQQQQLAAPCSASSAPLHVFNLDARAFLRLLCDTPGGLAGELRRQQEGGQQEGQAGQQGQEGTGLQQAEGQDQLAETQRDQQQQGQQQAEAAAEATASTAAANGERGEDGASAPPPPAADNTTTASPTPSQHPAKRQKRAQQKSEAAPTSLASLPPPPPVPAGFLPPPGGLLFDHVVMNLPASALEFLDAFSGAFDPAVWGERQLPTVHCYCFKRGVESEADILAKAERYLGGPLEPGSVSIHTVRDVAPNKLMLCLSFPVPREVAFKGRR
ncbi:hypothetical protein Agub_g5548 [Astrephomene gubernaculifera]|uniref:tRNA (guanine(37)-N1)-methyltransferase n=1 Tax=Astrephomene gubernaculifera TaxID=47775 RepID=A0AAD3DPI1_9CHLO|nr:hypothetical protein Agub_g5548 [Astrephomene gubernaculifera]